MLPGTVMGREMLLIRVHADILTTEMHPISRPTGQTFRQIPPGGDALAVEAFTVLCACLLVSQDGGIFT
ncbi:hypothetical protein, partial [Methanovulcanius yangii]|uniref:hypothetical protein n=1 Tax=Methanovulcanius yangii TaxID=1789227 RepID=UPI0029CA0759